MRVRMAVISDIHGNLEAFQQILADIKISDVDLIVNLGDSVGYGPEPEAVLFAIQNEGIVNRYDRSALFNGRGT